MGAHPRSRGENGGTIDVYEMPMGSSPLTRGKPWAWGRRAHAARLIPAHAGKTMGLGTPRSRSAAHPRSRGENGWAARVAQSQGGSSPLTRGKLLVRRDDSATDRLIPAHAGKTRPCSPPSTTEAAHPRSRGENDASCDAEITWRGSSPLTRGKRSSAHPSTALSRLIPAHAGKTSSLACALCDLAAHPRSRGENTS